MSVSGEVVTEAEMFDLYVDFVERGKLLSTSSIKDFELWEKASIKEQGSTRPPTNTGLARNNKATRQRPQEQESGESTNSLQSGTPGSMKRESQSV